MFAIIVLIESIIYFNTKLYVNPSPSRMPAELLSCSNIKNVKLLEYYPYSLSFFFSCLRLPPPLGNQGINKACY